MLNGYYGRYDGRFYGGYDCIWGEGQWWRGALTGAMVNGYDRVGGGGGYDIFNLSITGGIFPEKFKISRTVPIFKAVNPTLCDNYRPISLLSTLSKILEKFIAIQLTNHLELNGFFYKHQYSFQRGKSTEHNLVHLTNSIYSALNEKKYSIGLFLELKKAFDVCSHEILL
jgi:hypothetical protein